MLSAMLFVRDSSINLTEMAQPVWSVKPKLSLCYELSLRILNYYRKMYLRNISISLSSS